VRSTVPQRYRPQATRLLQGAAAIALRGDSVRCPCCGKHFRRFLDYPMGFCLGCGSYERQRLLAILIEHRPELCPPGARVLHVGPEASIQLVLRRVADLDYVAIDVDHPLATFQMDVRSMSFPSASFDLALCFHVLDVLPDERQALRELTRVVASTGTLVVAVPGDGNGYPSALEAQGLEVEVVRADRLCTSFEVERYGLIGDECLFLCRRR
jgi:SAM-dependent methyltransferase